ncbi:MAG: class I SAM-dependent methyltransferase [Oscillospiraceae bacterium]
METLDLQPRLQAIADWVRPGARLADVGTDHGYLPVWLLQNGRIGSAIAADLRRGPLEHARRTAAACGVAPLDFRLCDGLTGIAPHETDTIVIAGMGGETIAAILSAAPWLRETCPTLLLQPMTKSELLRAYLAENGYRVLRERLVRDKGKLYPILEAIVGTMPSPTRGQLYGGFFTERDPLAGDYLAARGAKLQHILDGLGQAEHGGDRAAQLSGILREIRSMERAWSDANGQGNGTGTICACPGGTGGELG